MNKICLFISLFYCHQVYALAPGFVYLKDIDASILQDIRYAGDHNFVGRPIKGYNAAECILTLEAARALSKVQTELKPSGQSLKVYDCYRPMIAVLDFIDWSRNPNDQLMKAEFYPRVNKKDFFRLGYVSKRSGHSRGSTVDLTIVALPALPQAAYSSGDKLVPCFAAFGRRYQDNSIDMGTGFDCMDIRSAPLSHSISMAARSNRKLLRQIMRKYGFIPSSSQEWWHFTFKNEPYPAVYFNFPITPG